MSGARPGAGIVGLGAVACVACCVGPILGLLGGLGLAGVAGTYLFGLVGLLVAATVGGVLLWRCRRGATTCAPADEAQPVAVAVGLSERSPR